MWSHFTRFPSLDVSHGLAYEYDIAFGVGKRACIKNILKPHKAFIAIKEQYVCINGRLQKPDREYGTGILVI